jgi:hypothetical protein
MTGWSILSFSYYFYDLAVCDLPATQGAPLERNPRIMLKRNMASLMNLIGVPQRLLYLAQGKVLLWGPSSGSCVSF